jgi:hypothetical protein
VDPHQVTRLTAQWLDELPGEDSTVLSGLGVWPLLAILADVADGPARDELAAAAGTPYAGLLNTPELRMALGLWTRPSVPLEPGLDKVLPIGVLASQEALDQWVVEQTDGLLQKMPVQLDDDLLLLLASALAVRMKWALPFYESPRSIDDNWVRWLTRSDPDLQTVRRHSTPGGPLTVVTVRGAGEIDVRLVVGEPGRGRSAVLAAALRIEDEGIGGDELLRGEPAPGVTLIDSPSPAVILSMPYFEVDAEHDLLKSAAVFGLVTASDASRGHFPGLSSMPLAVSQAKQSVMARFSATGFEAAAVTVIPMAAGSAPMPPRAKALYVYLEQPFGFIAVHRPTGLPLVAGWITASARQPA